MQSKIVAAIISVVFILACASRVLGLVSLPPSLNWDEISLGYNAYALSTSGEDEWGIVMPTIFRAYGDYKLPGYVYALVPIIKVFGLNGLTTRSISVFSGFAYSLAIYLLLRKGVPKHKYVAIITSLAMLLIPWSWFLSRVALEANLGLLFVILAMTCLLYKKFSSASLMFGLSVWTYNANRIFIPIFILIYILFYRKEIKKQFVPLAVLAGFLLPMLVQLLLPTGLARFRWTTILDEGAILQINESRSLPGGRLLNNKATYLFKNISINYIKHFGPNYLFLDGGSQYQFNIPKTGLLFLIQLPFFYIGFLYLIFGKKNNFRRLILLWLVLSPIPSSVTRDAPHVLRSISLLAPVVIVSTLGLQYAMKKFRYSHVVYGIGILISFFVYTQHISEYQSRYAWAWQYGHEQMVEVVKEIYKDVDEIVVTKKYGEPHEFVLFYWTWSPTEFRGDKNLVRYARSDWFWVDAFDKFRFVNDWEMGSYVANLPAGKKYLIVTSPSAPTIGSAYRDINFPDGSTAFRINRL